MTTRSRTYLQMPSNSFCPTWSSNSSVSALGVFLGTTKPPIRVLASLHGTCRDVRRGFTDSPVLQTPPPGPLMIGSHKPVRIAASISASKDAQTKLTRAITMDQLDVAAEELKRLQSSGLTVEPYTVEQLIEGALSCCMCFPPSSFGIPGIVCRHLSCLQSQH